jgi:predicted nuclease of restriction endonuclease-like (RecB) superfamily
MHIGDESRREFYLKKARIAWTSRQLARQIEESGESE